MDYIYTIFDTYIQSNKIPNSNKNSNKGKISLSKNKDVQKKETHQNQMISISKKIGNLKEQDPLLYKFKKLYKTENVYSKIYIFQVR